MKPPLPPDPDATPSLEERRAADELRDALADPARPHDDAAFARALALAHAPRDLSSDENEALIARALGRAESNVRRLESRRGRASAWLALGAGAAAMAAAALIFSREDEVAEADPVVLVEVHSTASLFREPFHGGASSRIDRIAGVRSDEWRDNMFARWNVK